jgi:DNA-binding LytR/AlgR family response regulator
MTNAGHAVAGQASDMLQAIRRVERIEGGIDVAIMDINLARGSNGVGAAPALEHTVLVRQR